MSEGIYTIVNPLKFMTEELILEKLNNYGFPKEVVSINIITNEQLAKEIELFFKIPEIGQKFFIKYNGKSFGFGQNYKLNIKKGKSSEISIIPKEKEIIYNDKYESWIDIYYMRKMKEQGLILVNPHHKEIQSKMIEYLFLKINSTFIKGQNIINFLFPLISHDMRTLLQVYAYELKEAPYILNKVNYITDPIERLKQMTCFVISQIYLSPLRIMPFIPILGESYQVKIANLYCYFEQTCIDPPTTNIYCFDSDGLYKIYGHISIYTKTGINNCKIIKNGYLIVQYKNGQRYKIYYPSYNIGGITIGKRSFNVKNSSLVVDETNRLVSYTKFCTFSANKYPDEFVGKLISINEVKIDQKGAKHLIIEEDSIPLGNFEGEWTQELRFGNKIYWKRNKINLYKLYEPEYKLKSDSSLRKDLILYNENKIEEAEKIYIDTYKRQNNDFILRNKNKK